MYDRKHDDGELNFEASGALEQASLVMRDKETDSWWSLMRSAAIGGELDGMRLTELPVGEKVTWLEWKKRHPATLVLSVEGREHAETSPYDQYFSSDRTFRGAEVADQRLAAKEPVYSFWMDDRPFAVAHALYGDGRIMKIPGDDQRRFFFYRPAKASIYRSTDAYVIPASTAGIDMPQLLASLQRDEIDGAQRLAGFDTFWYTWIHVNPDTRLLR